MKKITISVPDDFPLYLDLMSDYLGIPKSRLITRQLDTYFNYLVDSDSDFLFYLQSIAAGSGA